PPALALDALAGAPRQHAVFGRDPPPPLAAQEGRDALLDGGRAGDPGGSHLDQDRPLGRGQEARNEANRPQLRGSSAVGPPAARGALNHLPLPSDIALEARSAWWTA